MCGELSSAFCSGSAASGRRMYTIKTQQRQPTQEVNFEEGKIAPLFFLCLPLYNFSGAVVRGNVYVL